MMRFLLTLNMPSAQGNSVHQVIFEYPAQSSEDLCKILNDEIFILGRQLYKRQNPDGTSQYLDRGDIIINTAHIGKAQEYVEYDRQEETSHGKQREPLRPKFMNY